jgi:hypothetical protein
MRDDVILSPIHIRGANNERANAYRPHRHHAVADGDAVSKYAEAARDIIELLEGPALNEVLFAWLAERLAGLDEDEMEVPRSNVVFVSFADYEHCDPAITANAQGNHR